MVSNHKTRRVALILASLELKFPILKITPALGLTDVVRRYERARWGVVWKERSLVSREEGLTGSRFFLLKLWPMNWLLVLRRCIEMNEMLEMVKSLGLAAGLSADVLCTSRIRELRNGIEGCPRPASGGF